ncbi:GTPase-associated system all-helical protein GASH [Burkholderia gladioli]|uniref:GTPase-associated system all-helical protein GASH n=1 Tax=Burkholderia gladioli TaxID=28095 RepID=UPI001640631B|nr:GTPase-associated system all-helical protein GASH [Burkholderia gladioli]
MATFNFADRYAEAGIAPTAAVIASREAPAERIRKDLTIAQAFDLVGIYYGFPDLNLTWFRDQFQQEDAAFSLINNERECTVLAAAILGARVAGGFYHTIAAINVANLQGHNQPREAGWLLADAKAAYTTSAVAARNYGAVDASFKLTPTPKLGDEITDLPVNDWPALLAVLTKIRTESQDAVKAIAAKATAAIDAIASRTNLLREDSQMLWWLIGEHSRDLNRHFSKFTPAQGAILIGTDLANLATATWLGPVAAPAMIERGLRITDGDIESTISLASAIDGFDTADLAKMATNRNSRPARIFPIMTAIEKAKEIGKGRWHEAYKKMTGIDATIEFSPPDLAMQVYLEYLLSKFK